MAYHPWSAPEFLSRSVQQSRNSVVNVKIIDERHTMLVPNMLKCALYMSFDVEDESVVEVVSGYHQQIVLPFGRLNPGEGLVAQQTPLGHERTLGGVVA